MAWIDGSAFCPVCDLGVNACTCDLDDWPMEDADVNRGYGPPTEAPSDESGGERLD